MAIKFTGINIHAKDPVKTFEFYEGLGLTVKTEVAADDNGMELNLILAAHSFGFGVTTTASSATKNRRFRLC